MGENRRSALRNPHYRGVLVYVMGEYRTLSPTTFLIGNLAMGDNGGTAAEIYPLPKIGGNYSLRKFIVPWRRCLVVSSPPATEEIGAMGRDIESLRGTGW
jgi:hypothetical protein